MPETRNQTHPADAGSLAEADDWMSLPQAAAAIGKHRQTVEKLARQRRLTAKDMAGRTFISRKSVERFKAQQEAAAGAAA